jgi:hypothetical protein
LCLRANQVQSDFNTHYYSLRARLSAMRVLRVRSFVCGFVVALLALATVFQAKVTHAEEPKQEFIEALKNKRYFDIAAEYLNLLLKNENLKPEEKLGLLYEQGEILYSKAQVARQPKDREENFALAQVKLKDFVKDAGDHPKVPDAYTRIAQISLFRGINLRKAALKGPAATRAEEYKKARELLKQARLDLDIADKRLVALLKPLNEKQTAGKQLTDEENNLKDKYYPDLMQARYSHGNASYELALTFDPKTEAKEFKAAIDESNAKYKDIITKFGGGDNAGKYPVVNICRVGEVRNLMLLEQYPKAVETGWQVIETEGIPQTIQKRAFRVVLEAMHTGKLVDKKNWADVESTARSIPRISTAEDAEIYYFMSLCAESSKIGGNADAIKKRIEKYLRPLLRYRSQFDFFTESRELAKRLKIDDSRSSASFPEAYIETTQLFTQYNKALQELVNFTGSAEERKEAEQNRDSILDATHEAAQSALQIAPRDIKPNELALLRYILCNYNSNRKDYYEAAIWGEATMQTKDQNFAKAASTMVLKAWQEIRNEVQNGVVKQLQAKDSSITRENPAVKSHPDVAAMNRQLMRAASVILNNWAASSEADSARLIMVATEVDFDRYAEAQKLISQMKADSDTRMIAEITLGSVTAQKYLNDKLGKNATDQSKASADKLKPYAIDGLKSTLTKLLDKKLDERAVMAAFLYTTIQISEGLPDKDILKLLDHPKQGLKAKVLADEDLPERYEFDIAQNVFQVYLLSNKTEDAIKVVQELETKAKDDPARRARVNSILLRAGQQLDNDIRSLIEAGQKDKAGKMIASYEQLLAKLESQADKLAMPAVYSVCESYVKLADVNSAKKKEYLDKAEKLYAKMLSRAAAEPDFATKGQVAAIKLRQIGLLRNSGQYEVAYKQLYSILEENPMNLGAQKEAAYTLQDWADNEKTNTEKQKRFVKACNGEKNTRGDKVIVWGWNNMFKYMRANPKFDTTEGKPFRDAFFEARYNLALCMFKTHELQTTEENKTKYLEMTLKTIRESYANVSKDLGGESRKADFEKLLKQTQAALKLKVNGFLQLDEELKAVQAAGG